MSWNDDSNKSQKDPWSGKDKNQGPPDLDKVFKQVFSRFFSAGKKRRNGGSSGGDGSAPQPSAARRPWMLVLVIVVILVIIWFLSGIYIVQPAEQAVVLRFGKYQSTQNPGLHWIPRFIDSKTIVNIQQVNTFGYQSEMLTEDENIVSVEVAVQYQLQNPFNFLYNVADPIVTLQQATASALRQVVGNMTLDTVLTTGRQSLSTKVDQQLNDTLSIYKTGIKIVAVTLQPTKPPEQVTAAFNDAIRAREDEVRYQNQADAYASKVVPIATGQAKRILAEAKAYEQQIVLHAKADVANFNALLPQYKRDPAVMRERMYISTIESMLENSSKILVANQKHSQNMMYLPLQKLLSMPNTDQNTRSNETDAAQVAAAASTISTAPEINTSSNASAVPPDSGYARGGYTFNNNNNTTGGQ